MKKIIIFDVCHTLVDTNSTFSYVDYLLDKWIKPWYKILFHNKLLWYFYYFLWLFFRFDVKIFLTKSFFKWLVVKDINILSQDYYKRYEEKIFPNMLTIINRERKTSKIILLSSSINQPIDYLKYKFGIDWFSSKLEEKNWKYTWKILLPLWWRKETIFEKNYFSLIWYKEINYYTDNHDDINLIKYFNRKNNNLKIYIRSYWNKKYWNNFFSINWIKHEYLD